MAPDLQLRLKADLSAALKGMQPFVMVGPAAEALLLVVDAADAQIVRGYEKQGLFLQ